MPARRIPMFHVEQLFTLIGVASVCLGATPTPSGPLPCPVSEPSFLLPLASDGVDVAQKTALGFEALLYGDEVEARQHLTAARAIDPTSPLPCAGLALLSRDGTERAAYLEQLRTELVHVQATPVEAFHLSAFLKLLGGNTSAAARELADRSDRFTRDRFSAAWAILLLHYSDHGRDAAGKYHAELQESLQRAQAFYETAGKDFLPACYLRALVEESLPEISETALAAAKYFAEQLPDSPVAQNLYGHLLYKTGSFAEAREMFHLAYTSAKNTGKEMLALRARLYESVALWSDKNDKAALAIRRELNALSYTAASLEERDVFLAWESHTLPLRILVLRETLPTPSELRAALDAASPKNNKQELVHAAAQCIADTISARLLFRSGKKSQAIAMINKVETRFREWEGRESSLESDIILTPYKRLRTASIIAINQAKAEIYPSSSETWSENISRASDEAFSDSWLPPIVPKR